MHSRAVKDPYSFSFQEVDSRVSASLKAEADLKRKTEKLQKELQGRLLAHHREKIELHDFLADLRAPLGPRLVRTRKHSLGRGGQSNGGTARHTTGRKPQSEPVRRLSEPVLPVNHFPSFTLHDPFAWVAGNDDDSDDDDVDDDIDELTILSGKRVTEHISKVPPLENWSGVTHKESLTKTRESGHNLNLLPLIKKALPSNVCKESADRQGPLKVNRWPAIASPTASGSAKPAASTERVESPSTDGPKLTISTLAKLQMGNSDIRKRIQKWCDNIAVELFPFAESERQGETAEQQAGSGPPDSGVQPPTITVTDVNANLDPPRSSTYPPLVKSQFLPRNFVPKALLAEAMKSEKGPLQTARSEPASPGDRPPTKSVKALSSYHDSSAKVAAQRKLSTVTATDLRVVSKSMQSFHACKVYQGRNSIPTSSTDSKAFEDLARAQYRLVQRQRVRARHQGTSYDYGERVDAQIKKRNSARWSM